MPDDKSLKMPTPVGGSCLPKIADFFGKEIPLTKPLDAECPSGQNYVVVHLFLTPGDVTVRRLLRSKIQTELTQIGALRLHDLAYLIPCSLGTERATAENAWERLIFAGTNEDQPLILWDAGDVVYIHYLGDNSLSIISEAPTAKQPLSPLLRRGFLRGNPDLDAGDLPLTKLVQRPPTTR